MLAGIFIQYPYITLFLFSFFCNIPLGAIREKYAKFSFLWIFWIHASIPLIIYLRIQLGTSKLVIPLTIFLAILGQILGSNLRRKMMTDAEFDKLNQIQDLKILKSEHIDESQVTIALLNMGGPAKNSDVKSFQQHLFADARLIRFPLSFLLQKLFAKLLILLRSKATEERYQLIGGGSPIYTSTAAQLSALKKELLNRGRQLDIVYSFNYSPPFPKETIDRIKNTGNKYILPLSLYPHYSHATTGSNIYYLKKEAESTYPDLNFLEAPSYYLHDGYIQAFADRINEQMKEGESLDDFYLLFSAHGLPIYFLKEGDPYPFQIHQSVSAILSKIKRKENWIISYQSAVGPLQWLKPSTENVIKALNKRGIKKLLIVPVSFVGDHIETICEIDIEYRQLAEQIGIKDYRMSMAIETHPGFITALADSVEACVPQTISSKAKLNINQPIKV